MSAPGPKNHTSEPTEPTVIINGLTLTEGQSLTVRVALNAFIAEKLVQCGHIKETPDKTANARLIAAAPDLLTAAEALLDKIGYVTWIEPERRALIAAIANATGTP